MYTIDSKIVIEKLKSSSSGLTGIEAENRLRRYGQNLIKRKGGDSWLKVLWRQINSSLIWVLIGASVFAVVLGKITDGLVVLAVVIINTIIGFIQEYKAGKAIEALSDMIPQYASVLRDKKTIIIPVSELVLGDIVHLKSGDRVPADMRLIDLKNLQIDEAALTGESVPVQKDLSAVEENVALADKTCMVYSGTLVSSGRGVAIVTGTGENTELGKISNMLDEAADLETPLTKKLETLGNHITVGVLVITVIIMIVGTVRATTEGIELATALKDSLIFAIALAVGAIPEGLPAVVTIALAIGVQRMAKRHAIIRKLPAVETLGSTTVICSDKTGTLTRNEMMVTHLWTFANTIQITGEGYIPEGNFIHKNKNIALLPNDIVKLLTYAVLCNDSEIHQINNKWEVTGSPTESALVVAGYKAKIYFNKSRKEYPLLDIFPFESENKFMATLHKFEDRKKIIIKGAPEVIINHCKGIDIPLIHSEIEKMGSKGMRVLAIAVKDANNNEFLKLGTDKMNDKFTFGGLIGIIDPPRTEVIDAIKVCHSAGIEVKMITGDHKATAYAIGKELGLIKNNNVITGIEISGMKDDELVEKVHNTNIFARVSPEHKLRIVKALQDDNQIVAMTGDGVNDAPSLKQANIGIAMGITGTSVSKESGDIILTDDNFSSISAAVEEGRRVYDNLIKSLAFLLPTNLGLALILIYSIIFFPFNPITKELLFPMLPVQILWINLVAAVTLALPLAFEAIEPNIMKLPPRKNNELLSGVVLFRIVLVSILMTVGTIALFKWAYANAISEQKLVVDALSQARTIAVTFVILFQVFYLLNCRSLRDSIAKIGFFSNYTIFIGIASILILQALFIYNPFMQKVFNASPLGLRDIALSFAAGFVVFPIIGIEKWILKKINK